MYSALENTPIQVDLITAGRDTGWSISGTVATHVACNDGNIILSGYNLIPGVSYRYTYNVITCSSGYVTAILGTAEGAHIIAPQFVDETVTADGTQFLFYANGNCSIEEFTINPVVAPVGQRAMNTISFSEKSKKWVSFYTYIPDNAFNLFTNIYSFFQGDLYLHETGSNDRNTFYGTPYASIIQFVDNINPTTPKQFMSLSMQSNELMITTTDGITTSLGQVSELSSVDFVKDYLSDGISQVNVQAVEGIFSANLLRDKNSPDGLENGDNLRGNYMIVELISPTNGILQLFTVNVVSVYSPVGAR